MSVFTPLSRLIRNVHVLLDETNRWPAITISKISRLIHVKHQRGEPLNVIISGRSDPTILTTKGFLKFIKVLNFEPECLNLHIGDLQYTNLKDGNDWSKQLFEIRQSYINNLPFFGGTCLESAIGGNHFRAWNQNGTLANSSAWFLAVSLEYDYRRNHMM